MANLKKIEGIGPVYAGKLASIGVLTTGSLLREGSTPKGRKGLAERADVSDSLILTWVNKADLFRINGVGEEFSDLLEQSGVDTVPELAQRKPDNLVKKMQEVNEEKNLVRRLPARSAVESWVSQAKSLDRVVKY